MRFLIATLLVVAACHSDGVDRKIGAECNVNGDCEQKCLPPATDYPGGFCTVACMTNADCGRDDAVCIDAEGGVCLLSCRDDADCALLNGDATGWHCKPLDLEGGAGQAMACRGD